MNPDAVSTDGSPEVPSPLVAGYRITMLNLGGDGYEDSPSLLGLFLAPEGSPEVSALAARFSALAGVAPAGARARFGDLSQPGQISAQDHWIAQACTELGLEQPEPWEAPCSAAQLRAQELRASAEAFTRELGRWLLRHHRQLAHSPPQLFIAWLLRDCGWREIEAEVWTLGTSSRFTVLEPIEPPGSAESHPSPWRQGPEQPDPEDPVTQLQAAEHAVKTLARGWAAFTADWSTQAEDRCAPGERP